MQRYNPSTLEEKEKEKFRETTETENNFKVHQQRADQDRAWWAPGTEKEAAGGREDKEKTNCWIQMERERCDKRILITQQWIREGKREKGIKGGKGTQSKNN